jgi:HEAT repeat protein
MFALGCATIEDHVANLKHVDTRPRERSALKLVNSGAAAVGPIVGTLLDEEAGYRERAFFVLGQIGPPARDALPALGAALRSENADQRRVAAWALGRIGKAALKQIAEGFRHEKLEVRISAACALAFVGPKAKPLVPELVKLMEEEDPGARLAAAEAAGRIGPWAKKAVPALLKLAQATPAPTVPPTEPNGDEATEEDADATVRSENGNGEVRAAAFEALGRIGEHAAHAVPGLAELLAGECVEIRLMASRTPAQIGPNAKKAAPMLGRALADADEDVRRHSLLALVGTGSVPKFAVCDFLGALEEHARTFTDQADGEDHAAEALGEFRKALTPVLVELARDKDPVPRRRAVWGLGVMPRTKYTLPTLSAALEDEDALVRREAVTALGRLGPKALPHALAVGMMLGDPDAAVRRAADEAVRKILPSE